MANSRKYILFFTIALVISTIVLYINFSQKKQVNQINGAKLYKTNCAPCHKPDNEFTGPFLKGALKRWGGDKKAMYAFIRRPMLSIETNPYAKKLFEKYGKTQMTAFNFTDSELDAMMDYWEKAQ